MGLVTESLSMREVRSKSADVRGPRAESTINQKGNKVVPCIRTLSAFGVDLKCEGLRVRPEMSPSWSEVEVAGCSRGDEQKHRQRRMLHSRNRKERCGV